MADSGQGGHSDAALSPADAAQALREHLALCRELLAVVEREQRALQSPESFSPAEFAHARKSLLPRLRTAYKKLKEVGFHWQQLHPAERSRCVEVTSLIRQNQDVMMKVILLDRGNERAMLRLGLVPALQLPSANRQRPNFVAKLYLGHGNG